MKPKFKKRNLNQLNSLTEGLVRHEVKEHQSERDYPLSRFNSDMGSSIKQYESGTYAHKRGAGKETPSERAARMTQLENEEMAKAEMEHAAYKKSQAAKSAAPASSTPPSRPTSSAAPSYRPSNTSTQQRNQQSPVSAPTPKHLTPSPSTPQTDKEIHAELRKKRLEYQKTPEYKKHYKSLGSYPSGRENVREKPSTYNKSGSGRTNTYTSTDKPATADDYRWNDRGAPGQAQNKAEHVNAQRNVSEFRKTPEYGAMQKAQEKNANDPHYQRNKLKAKRLGMSTDELADKKGTFRSAYMNKKAEEAAKQRDQRSTKETVKQFMTREVPRDYKRERTKSNQPKR